MEITLIIHDVGTVLGLGGAIASAVLMMRLRTDEQRLKRGRIARRISPVTWCGFILLIISGVILSLNFEFWYSHIFAVKHLLVVVLLVDAIFIHFRYFPRYFRQLGTAEFDKTYTMLRRIGTLSVTCWVIIMAISIYYMVSG
ncbi:MAG: hypothetical protein JXB43_02370 [Dehalococcoidia bacterium]|nr:hypothetical protein [Dehalococcoidia bacterium]